VASFALRNIFHVRVESLASPVCICSIIHNKFGAKLLLTCSLARLTVSWVIASRFLFITALEDIARGNPSELKESEEVALRLSHACLLTQLYCGCTRFPKMVSSCGVTEIVRQGAGEGGRLFCCCCLFWSFIVVVVVIITLNLIVVIDVRVVDGVVCRDDVWIDGIVVVNDIVVIYFCVGSFLIWLGVSSFFQLSIPYNFFWRTSILIISSMRRPFLGCIWSFLTTGLRSLHVQTQGCYILPLRG